MRDEKTLPLFCDTALLVVRLRHASTDDLREIYAAFAKRRDVFPHIRQDALKRMIVAGRVIYDSGVVLTFQRYVRKTKIGSVVVPAHAIMLHQLLNTQQFNGSAGRVFESFVTEIVRDSDLYLSVRADNAIARAFYERHKMHVVGDIQWSGGALLGVVYKR